MFLIDKEAPLQLIYLAQVKYIKQPTDDTHQMLKKAKSGVFKLKALNVQFVLPFPGSVK